MRLALLSGPWLVFVLLSIGVLGGPAKPHGLHAFRADDMVYAEPPVNPPADHQR
jgi:hypothetical protein